jgi:hypothetical protein
VTYFEVGQEVRLGGTRLLTERTGSGITVRAPGARLRKNGLSCIVEEAAVEPEDVIQMTVDRVVYGLRLVADDAECFAPTLARRLTEGAWGPIGLSVFLHLAAIGALQLGDAPPSEDAELEAERVAAMRTYAVSAGAQGGETPDHDAAAESTRWPPIAEAPRPSAPGGAAKPLAVATSPERVPRPVSREEALAEASVFGMIGLLTDGPALETESSWSMPASGAWGSLSESGVGLRDLGDIGGLGLSGTGEGCSPCRGEGIGLGRIGTVGHGRAGDGFTGFRRTLGGTHRARSPSIRCLGAPGDNCVDTTVSGRLPPEVIQRIVRQNHGRMRLCYENGLRENPSLSGRISVKFVIGRDGSVATSALGESDLANEEVERCVVQSFAGLTFPEPEGGIVTVVYPLVLSLEG